jgi:hypothetical protein
VEKLCEAVKKREKNSNSIKEAKVKMEIVDVVYCNWSYQCSDRRVT